MKTTKEERDRWRALSDGAWDDWEIPATDESPGLYPGSLKRLLDDADRCERLLRYMGEGGSGWIDCLRSGFPRGQIIQEMEDACLGDET